MIYVIHGLSHNSRYLRNAAFGSEVPFMPIRLVSAQTKADQISLCSKPEPDYGIETSLLDHPAFLAPYLKRFLARSRYYS